MSKKKINNKEHGQPKRDALLAMSLQDRDRINRGQVANDTPVFGRHGTLYLNAEQLERRKEEGSIGLDRGFWVEVERDDL